MKRIIAAILCVTSLIVCAFSGCGSTEQKNPAVPETTTSFREKASFYDELAKGEVAAEVATTNSGNDYKFEGDTSLLPVSVYDKMINIIDRCQNAIYREFGYGSNANSIVVTVNSNYDGTGANYSAGNTIVINADWYKEHQNDCDSLIYGLVGVSLAFPSDVPEWLTSSIMYYGRYKYHIYDGKSSWSLPAKYSGGSYKDGEKTGAAFLKWLVSSTNSNIPALITQDIHKHNKYDASYWVSETGMTLEKLWAKYTSGGE